MLDQNCFIKDMGILHASKSNCDVAAVYTTTKAKTVKISSVDTTISYLEVVILSF